MTTVPRRLLLRLGAALLAWPAPLLAQPGGRFRVGGLFLADQALVRPFEEALLAGLRDHGYVVGRNLAVDIRYAGGDSGRLPALADELIALRPDVLAGIELVAVVLRARTTTIPIVLTGSTDPVAAGLVQSLRRPGTNVTGMANLGDQLVAKHVELLTEIVPGLARVALVNDPFAPAADRFERFARAAAAAKGLGVVVVAPPDARAVRRAFDLLERERTQALVVVGTGRMNQLRSEILLHARRLRLPAISALPAAVWAEAGGLATYSTNVVESYRQAATHVDRILRGASPADLPIEQSARFDFVVNLATARELGLAIPPSVLLRADRVIE
jgi:putative ABC transport system substrate-binding protein